LTGSIEWVYCTMGDAMGMKPSIRPLGALLLALAAMGCADAARADLAPVSPFLPANAAASATAAGPSGPIELRGIMATPDGVPAFCIYDTAKKKDVWVGLNETGHDFVVRSSDPGSDSVKVDYQGRSMKLTLRASKVVSAGSAQAPQIVSQQVLSSVAANPTLGDEQKRLDAVAQEVRRRRLEREKAAQEAQSGQAPPAVPNR
jgi:hypothetical protein